MKTKLNGFLTLFLALLVQISFAQERIVSGIVTDNSGLPIPGVSILIKGTTTGTQTDFDGKYSIKTTPSQVLIFSFIGMKEQEILASSTTINVKMEDNSIELEGVVVTALGIKRKPDEITTSTQRLKADELVQANNPDVVQGLAGKVSGLQINTTSSGLTPSTDIYLRGYKTISGDGRALVVIDNIVSTASILSNLDPNIIESINVLKGANGAALYGSLGGNGVIIVTTKKGTKNESKFSIDLKSTISFEEIAYLPQRQDRFGQGWEGNFDWTDQGAWGPEFDGSLVLTGTPYPSVTDWRYKKYEHIEDNIKPFFDTGTTYQNSVTLSAGNADNFLSLSANRQSINGVIPSNKNTKDFFDFKAGKKLGKLDVKGIARYITEKTDRATNNTYFNLSQGATNIRVEDYNSGDNNDNWTLYADSPYWSLKNQRTNVKSNTFDVSGEINYELNKNISFTLRSSARVVEAVLQQYSNAFVDNRVLADTDRSITARYDKQVSQSKTLYTDFLTNFDYELTKNISFKANVGANSREVKTEFTAIGGNGFTIPGFYDISNVTDISASDTNESNTIERNIGVFANLDLGYKDYLFLNLTGRNDWTSKLKPQNYSFFYPSAGVSFIPTKAFPELKGKILDKAKISVSIVKVGNVSAVGAHNLNNIAIQGSGFGFPYDGGINSFLFSTNTFDANLEPEFVTSTELNLNLEFLRRNNTPRITLDVALGKIINTNQILSASPSYTSGASSALINIGETETKSYEVDLGFTPLKTENFSWSGSIGYSNYKTIVNKVTDESNELLTNSFTSGTVGLWAVEGEEFPLIKGTGYERDDAGHVILDGDGNPVRSSQIKTLGKVTPDYVINFTTNFKYKNLSLGATLDYRTGHQFYSNTANNLNEIGGTIESAYNGRQPFLFPNSVIETSPGVYVQNTGTLTGGSNAASFQSYIQSNYGFFDENFVLDATAVKLRELFINYDLPSKFLKNTAFQKITLGFSGRNLYTWLPRENRSYNDPEIGTGLETYGQTPPTRFYTFNINFVF